MLTTLRSARSAKVALGELLRLCPGSAGLSTSVEKAKTDCHDKARDWSTTRSTIGMFRIPPLDEGPLPGQAHTRPEFGERGASRGYIVAPPSNSMAK